MARGIKLQRCPDCLLPPERCICALRPQLSAEVSFCLLMHRLEPLKPTNTGRLIAECLADTRAYVWSRTVPDPALLALLQDAQCQPFLVFPQEYAAPEQPVCQQIEPVAGKRPLLVIIDATWNQARKMVRMSPWLRTLPLLHLQPERLSRYQLRRSCQAEHLCTAEVAVACLELTGNTDAASGLDDYFDTFNTAYHMTRLNRPLPDSAAQQRLRARQSNAG
ncbi:MAG: DTW domain-containing protein [Pseudomonadaceae bacterium]|nr:MAG: DTW domain-containing protein [Pseudomonadaceae bacterium]